MKEILKVNKKAAGYSVTLNKETYDLLMDVKETLTIKLGFEPTNGQVVRHLIAQFFSAANGNSHLSLGPEN